MTEKGIEFDFNAMNALNEHSDDTLIDLSDSDFGFTKNETENQNQTLVGEAIEISIEEGDSHLLIASISGIDPITGGQSSGAVNDISNIISNINIDVESLEVNENDVTNEIKVPLKYTKEEIEYFSDVFKGMITSLNYRKHNKINKKLLEERNIVIADLKNLNYEARELTKEINLFNSDSTRIKIAKNAFDKVQIKKPITKQESEVIRGLSFEEVNKQYSDIKYKENTYHRLSAKLIDKNKKLESKLEELTAKIKSEKEKLRPHIESVGQADVSDILNNISKIVQVELGYNLSIKGVGNKVFAVRCECSAITVSNLDKMPYYLSGDIYDDFDERTSIDRNVKQNLFLNRDVIRTDGTRRVLSKKGNETKLRVVIPGFNSEDSCESLICSGCKRKLMFSPNILERLTEHGSITDELINELMGSNKLKPEDVPNEVKVYIFERILPQQYLADLGLTEMAKGTPALISSDINKVDYSNKLTNKVTDDVLVYYAKLANIKENENIEEIIRNHIEGTKTVIRDLLIKYKVPNIPKTLEPQKIARKRKIAERNKKITRFLLGSKGLIIKYALDKNISRVGLTNLISENEDDINVVKREIESHLINDLVRSIVKDEPIIVIEMNKLKAIKRGGKGLPHVNFFKAYSKIIKKFLFANTFKKSSYIAETGKVKDSEEKRYSNLYDTFRKMNTLQQITDSKKAIVESEKIVKTLSDNMDSYYSSYKQGNWDVSDVDQMRNYKKLEKLEMDYLNARETSYKEYVSNTKLVSETVYSDGKVQCWIYDESLRFPIQNLQLQPHFEDVYKDLYQS